MTIIAPADHDAGWEYLYFASELARGLVEHRAEYEDYEKGIVHPTGEPVTDPAPQVHALTDELTNAVGQVTLLLSAQTLERAFGAPGKSGDEAEIRRVASGLVGMYAEMIAWGQRVRGTLVPPSWRPVYLALANYVDLPLHEVQDFSAKVTTTIASVVGDLRAGRDPRDEITLALNLTNDPEAVAEFQAAIATLRAGAGLTAAPIGGSPGSSFPSPPHPPTPPVQTYGDVRSCYDAAMPLHRSEKPASAPGPGAAGPQTTEVTVLLGDEALDVVGESHHQEALWSIVGGRTTDHFVHHQVYAVLVPENTNPMDSNAVAVWIDGHVVGYLSREDAVRYRPGLIALYQKHRNPIALQGVIIGGGPRGDGIGYLGVFLEHDPEDFGLPPSSTPQRSIGAHIRTGRHEANPSVAALDSLPNDDAAAIKQLRLLLATEQDLLTRHFYFAEIEHRLYHCRDAFASALTEFDAACEAHDREMDAMRPVLVAQFNGIPLLETYRQICIRKQKAHLFEDVIAWTRRGIYIYGDDALDPQFVNDLMQRQAHASEKLNPRQRVPRPTFSSSTTDPQPETLVCQRCSLEFTRIVIPGRKPRLCPACRGA